MQVGSIVPLCAGVGTAWAHPTQSISSLEVSWASQPSTISITDHLLVTEVREKMCSANKIKMYHCASIPSANLQLAFKSFDSAHDELFLLQNLSSNGTLDTKHSKPLFGDSEEYVIAAQFLPSLPEPCPLKALRRLGLSSDAKIQYFWSSEIYFLLLRKLNKYPYFLSIQFLTAVFKVRFITLLKPRYTSKWLWDFPPGRLCLFSFLFVPWEHTVNTAYIWERKRRCFPHSSCFSQQVLNGYSYQLSVGNLS